MLQDLIGSVVPTFKETKSWANNLIGSAVAVAAWGYFLYQGVIDPLGGINTLWPLFGISNQMLAGIALTLCTVILFKMKRQYYAWVTVLPTAWLLVCTLTAGLQKVISDNPAIGFISHAWKFGGAVSSGKVLAPAKSITEMQRIIFNDYLDATLAILFVAVVVAVVLYGLISVRKAFTNPNVTAVEIGAAAPAVEGIHA
jgi:carbon starvation protein